MIKTLIHVGGLLLFSAISCLHAADFEDNRDVQDMRIDPSQHSADGDAFFHEIFEDYQRNLENLENYLIDILKQALGESIFNISGYHQYPITTGVYGLGELHDKLRITLVNGILNYPHSQAETLEQFSITHAQGNIHYIFRSCEGWTRDIVRCLLCKGGFISEIAKLLAAKWRHLIQDMGGIDGGGTILHYAHSIGGSETYAAKNLMTPEEQKMIRVITFGSPTLIPEGGFQSVVNYTSRRDGVALFDVVNFIQGLVDPSMNIVYVDTFMGAPLVDHTLDSPSYKALIEELGAKAIEEFLSPDASRENRDCR